MANAYFEPTSQPWAILGSEIDQGSAVAIRSRCAARDHAPA